VVALLAASVGFGVLASQGVLGVDASSLDIVAPARGAVSEQAAAAADDSAFSVQIEPEIAAAVEADPMAATRVVPTPAPEAPVAIILPPPPTVRTGTVAGPSIPWSGPTGYVDGRTTAAAG
jgi:hypothetical protein